MSLAVFVSERASLLCTQIFVRQIQATVLLRRDAAHSCIFFVSLCNGTKVGGAMAQSNLKVSPRDTQVLTPT